jgi:hypothetical protein
MSEEVVKFVNEIKNVMFAKCNIVVPHQDMLDEFNNFMEHRTIDFVPFRTTEDNAKKYNLDVLSIIDQTTDPKNAGNYAGGKKLTLKPQATSLKPFFPKTLTWLRDTMPGIIRCKISRLPSTQVADFHHHPHRIPQLDGVFHIPLITNNGVRFHTRNREPGSPIKSCHFSTGHLWWFNAEDHIEHAVTNLGATDRWHLWINTRVLDTQYNCIGNDTLYNSLVNAEKF